MAARTDLEAMQAAARRFLRDSSAFIEKRLGFDAAIESIGRLEERSQA